MRQYRVLECERQQPARILRPRQRPPTATIVLPSSRSFDPIHAKVFAFNEDCFLIMDASWDSSRKWFHQPPASSAAITNLSNLSGLELPQDYLSFLALSNGGEGNLGIEPGWFSLWPAEEVVQLNRDYEVQKWLPKFFGFGSNGGGELLTFKTTTTLSWKIYMIPFGSFTDEDAIFIAQDFAEFAEAIGRKFDG